MDVRHYVTFRRFQLCFDVFNLQLVCRNLHFCELCSFSYSPASGKLIAYPYTDVLPLIILPILNLTQVPKDDVDVDWVRYAAIHTMNVSAGPFKFVDWWMSFLNYQIEHHLFPAMPQFRHPQTSLRVQKLFAKHGLKYDQRNYVESLQVTFDNLHNVGMDVFYG